MHLFIVKTLPRYTFGAARRPKIDIYSFYDKTTQNATLYVPVGSKEAYSKADYWKNFAHIEEYDF